MYKRQAFNRAKKAKSGKPQFILVKTIIGKGIPEVQGTQKAHGEGGAKYADSARAGLGLPADQLFYVSEDVREYFLGHKRRLVRAYNRWNKTFKAWGEANPEKAALLESAGARPSAAHLLTKIPLFAPDVKLAGTRARCV